MPAASTKTKTVRKKKVEDEVPAFKVSTHFLIPKHELLTKEEAEKSSPDVQRDPRPVPIHARQPTPSQRRSGRSRAISSR